MAGRCGGTLLLALLAGCGPAYDPTDSVAPRSTEPASAVPTATIATSRPTAAEASPSGADGRDFPPLGELSPGRYSMRRGGIGLTIQVPTGWFSNGSFLLRKTLDDGTGGQLLFWDYPPDGVYADPCAKGQAPVVGDPTAANLAAAISTIPGIKAADPVEADVGGRPAVEVAIEIPEDLACQPGSFYLWYDVATGGRWAPEAGSTMHVWIVTARTGTVWIDTEIWPDTEPSFAVETRTMIDSVTFDAP